MLFEQRAHRTHPEFALFTWIAPRWTSAVLVGGIIGAVADSMVFLSIAFGSLAFLDGQVLGKAYGIAFGALVVAVRRRSAFRAHLTPRSA